MQLSPMLGLPMRELGYTWNDRGWGRGEQAVFPAQYSWGGGGVTSWALCQSSTKFGPLYSVLILNTVRIFRGC